MKHVKQPTDNSCVSACVSMLTGIDIGIVMKEFHYDYVSHGGDGDAFSKLVEYLVSKGFSPFLQSELEDPTVYPPHLALGG